MADFKIKPAAGTGNLTLLQSQDQSGSDYAIKIGDSGASTLTNATLTSPTLTTPNLGTPSAVTLTNATFPAGHVLQVVSGAFTDASSTVTSTTMTNTDDFVDITITAGNKVLVLYTGTLKGNETGNDFIAARWGIKRDETAGPSQTDSQIVDQSLLGYSSDWTSHSGFWVWPCNCNYLDTPTATTTGLRYYVTIARYDHTNATSTQLYKTVSGVGSDNKSRQLTLLEIQA